MESNQDEAPNKKIWSGGKNVLYKVIKAAAAVLMVNINQGNELSLRTSDIRMVLFAILSL